MRHFLLRSNQHCIRVYFLPVAPLFYMPLIHAKGRCERQNRKTEKIESDRPKKNRFLSCIRNSDSFSSGKSDRNKKIGEGPTYSVFVLMLNIYLF